MLTQEEYELSRNLADELGEDYDGLVISLRQQLAEMTAARDYQKEINKEMEKRKDILYNVAHCGTVDSFLKCDDEVKRRYFAMMIEDSTERKKLEEQLAAITSQYQVVVDAQNATLDDLAATQAYAAQLREALAPLASCHLPPEGFEQHGVTAHFSTAMIVAAKKALARPTDGGNPK